MENNDNVAFGAIEHSLAPQRRLELSASLPYPPGPASLHESLLTLRIGRLLVR
jgi:hypothetical protein